MATPRHRELRGRGVAGGPHCDRGKIAAWCCVAGGKTRMHSEARRRSEPRQLLWRGIVRSHGSDALGRGDIRSAPRQCGNARNHGGTLGNFRGAARCGAPDVPGAPPAGAAWCGAVASPTADPAHAVCREIAAAPTVDNGVVVAMAAMAPTCGVA
ncbi:unnamed protein product [Lampetra planeri]